MSKKDFDISKLIQSGKTFSKRTLLSFVWKLSIPSILAQISSIIMQYIDSAMVGRIGAEAAASIGLVSPAMWLFGSICYSFVIGFSVQVAQAIGAGNKMRTKHLLCEGMIVCAILSVIVALVSFAISPKLPLWLGAEKSIHKNASEYFLVFQLGTPIFQTVYLMSMMLQSSGNMKTPAILNALMCGLDVIFNFIFIVVLKLGVLGAALGSVVAAFITAIAILYETLVKSPHLNLKNENENESDAEQNLLADTLQNREFYLKHKNKKHSFFDFSFFRIDKNDLHKAIRISLPLAGERVMTTGAMVVATKLIAPLGAVSLAAHSFAVTAESICYMPGYGIEDAATTLVGQSIGAKRADLAKRFAWLTVFTGVCVMSLAGALMYVACPLVFAFLTSDKNVQVIAIKILRIELFAEPLFAASIVAPGALRGANDTLVPAIMNFSCIWIVRIGLSIVLIPRYGLSGAWIAMSIELCFRGIIFLIRLLHTKWSKPF